MMRTIESATTFTLERCWRGTRLACKKPSNKASSFTSIAGPTPANLEQALNIVPEWFLIKPYIRNRLRLPKEHPSKFKFTVPTCRSNHSCRLTGRVVMLEIYCSLFKPVSGLNINLQKSEMVTVGVERLASSFRCKVGNLPTLYLALPLRVVHNSCVVWGLVEQRFKNRLASWKKK